MTEKKAWYQEFWAWFILAPLIVVVIVSSITVTIAVKHADDRVVDDYYKEGRMINHHLQEDIAAAKLSLTALIRFDQPLGEAVLQLQVEEQLHNPAFSFPHSVLLEMNHPSDQQQDQQLVFQHIAQGQYTAEFTQPFKYRWYLRLRPINETSWRLRGEMNFSRSSSVQLSVAAQP